MKITNVEAIVLKLPSISAAADGTQDDLIIVVETDEGITGYGEVDTAPFVGKVAVTSITLSPWSVTTDGPARSGRQTRPASAARSASAGRVLAGVSESEDMADPGCVQCTRRMGRTAASAGNRKCADARPQRGGNVIVLSLNCRPGFMLACAPTTTTPAHIEIGRASCRERV